MLTSKAIRELIRTKNCEIHPDIHESQISVNSIDLRLGGKITEAWQFDDEYCNSVDGSGIRYQDVPLVDGKFKLLKGHLYLGHTLERVKLSNGYVAHLHGRSSLARMFTFVHFVAGFGDVGFDRQWTLEIMPMINIILEPYQRICQLSVDKVIGDVDKTYSDVGRYSKQFGPVQSKGIGSPLRDL